MEDFLDISSLLRKSREEVQLLQQENQLQKEEIERLRVVNEKYRLDEYRKNRAFCEEADKIKSLEKLLATERKIFKDREVELNSANMRVNSLLTEVARETQQKEEWKARYSTESRFLDEYKANGERMIKEIEEKAAEIVDLNKKVHQYHLKYSIKREEYDHLLFTHQQRERKIQLLFPDLETLTRPMSVDQLMDEASNKAQQIEEKLTATQEELTQTLEKLGKVERQLAKVRTTNCVEENEKLRQCLAAANLNEHKKLIKLEKCLECLQTISECTICTNRYTTTGLQVPTVLASCGHTFCTECVSKVGKNVHNQIKCPTCRKFSSDKNPKNISIIQALVPTVYRLLEGDDDLVLE